MSLAGRITQGLNLRASLTEPGEVVVGAFGASRTSSGQTVSVRNSLSLVAVYSAVSQISGDIGSLPLDVYRRLDDGDQEKATDHRAWKLLHLQPNLEMAADELWEIVLAHLNLWGNAFLWKRRTSLGTVGELWPLEPSRIKVYRDDQRRRRFILDGDHGSPMDERDILHIRGLGLDGLVGLSPVQECREALGVAKAQGEFQGNFLRADGKPGVLLHHPNRISDDAARRLEKTFDATRPGSAKLLEEGITAEKWTMPLEDAQFLESMQFSDLRVAQMFKFPPAMLGAKTGDSLTYSTTESQGRHYVRHTLRRWMIRVENSLRRDAGIFPQGDRFFPKFNADALMRGDTKSRYEAYEIGIRSGVLDADEPRQWENLPKRSTPPPAPDETGP